MLRVSLLVNVVLIGLVLGLTVRLRTARLSAAVKPDSSSSVPLADTPEQGTHKQSETFHWSELESADYPTYVANLKSIGCPEQTIRDIITADVHGLYEPRRREVELRHAAISDKNRPNTPFEIHAVEAELQNIRVEEASVVTALLGPSSLTDVPPILHTKVHRSPEQTVTPPLVFQQFDPAVVKLDSRQAEVIAELRQKFRDDLSSSNMDTNAAAYRRRWQEAQRENDDLLAGLLGGRFFLDYEAHVAGN